MDRRKGRKKKKKKEKKERKERKRERERENKIKFAGEQENGEFKERKQLKTAR